MQIEVTKGDGSKEIVALVPVPESASALFRWIESQACNESRFIELVTGKPEGWSDSLTVESFERIVDAANTLTRRSRRYRDAVQAVAKTLRE
jgi:hypothetical protein